MENLNPLFGLTQTPFPLWQGALIGAEPTLIAPGLSWQINSNSFMSICSSEECGGNWIDRNGYIGLRFERDDGTHYGYMHFEADINAAAGWITGWAWETEPGRAITVQPIPESGGLIWLVAGTVFLLMRRRDSCGTLP